MTTLLVLRSSNGDRAIREVLDSVVERDERIHVFRAPSVDHLDALTEGTDPTVPAGTEYSTGELTDIEDVSELVAFAASTDAERLCFDIPARTTTGKVRIDDLVGSVLLHDDISGELVVGEHAIVLDGLEYG